MSVAHVSVFINGCLDDSSEWYNTRPECELFLTAAGFDSIRRYDTVRLPGSVDAVVHKYQLFQYNGLGDLYLSPHMAEITEYADWEFCGCVFGNPIIPGREYLDNETGIYDPATSTQCMACESEEWDAECAGADAQEIALDNRWTGIPDTLTVEDMTR